MRWPARWRRPVRFFGDLAIVVVVGYLGAIAYLYAYQVDLVFRPPPRGTLYTRSLAFTPERVIVAGANGLATEAWRITAPEPSPYWVLFLHGNAAAISSGPNVRRYDQLRQLGLNVFAVEYPGFGDSGGTASERGMQAAARAGYDHLRRVEGVPASHVVIYGWSLGTGAAVPLARDVEEAGLIVEGGFLSVLQRAREEYPVIPVGWILAHQFRSDDAIADAHCPVLFLHSPQDTVVPFHHGEALFAKAAEPKRLVRLAGGHIFPNAADADRYLQGIHGFLGDVLRWPVRPPRPSAGVAVAQALASGGLDAALAAWARVQAEGEARWNLAEYELQYVARAATLEARHDVAVALFRANRDRFPDSPLAWYELGRALAAADQRDDARRAFTRSIALEPGVLNPSHALLARVD
jgi:uncharacterized protein